MRDEVVAVLTPSIKIRVPPDTLKLPKVRASGIFQGNKATVAGVAASSVVFGPKHDALTFGIAGTSSFSQIDHLLSL